MVTDKMIRVSAAALAKIEFDNIFLLSINKDRKEAGNIKYTPFGGVLSYEFSIRNFLLDLGAQFERPETHDLRLSLPECNLDKFKEWFYTKSQRETSPFRELYEEFVEEEKVFPRLFKSDVVMDYLRTAEEREVTDKPGQEGKLTQRYLEIYGVKFSPDYELIIKNNIKNPESRLVLVTAQEIVNLKSNLGIRIGSNSVHLLCS